MMDDEETARRLVDSFSKQAKAWGRSFAKDLEKQLAACKPYPCIGINKIAHAWHIVRLSPVISKSTVLIHLNQLHLITSILELLELSWSPTDQFPFQWPSLLGVQTWPSPKPRSERSIAQRESPQASDDIVAGKPGMKKPENVSSATKPCAFLPCTPSACHRPRCAPAHAWMLASEDDKNFKMRTAVTAPELNTNLSWENLE